MENKYASYIKQETILILLNISVLAALFVAHIGFVSLLGKPSSLLLITLSARFITLILELIWVQKLDDNVNSKLIDIHTHFSIWLNIAFAFIASFLGGTADSHYSVLMIIPIITAAYRYNLPRTILVVCVTIALTFLEVWLYFKRNPPLEFTEFFEAATVSLIFFVVGIVVWLLVGNLRNEERKLQESFKTLQKMQEKLFAEEKMAAIGQLSSAVAHEIRNPVAMISSSLKLAEKQTQNSPIREEMFNIATEEAKRLEVLTTDFLLYARTKKPEKKRQNICEMIEYLADLAKAKLNEKNLEIETFCAENLYADIDNSQIQQALLNILMNAIDASAENRKIKLGAENAKENVIIFVENEGENISKENETKMFEPFFTAKPKGTGLGLSIVQSIMRLHCGEVVLAKNENEKVRFELRLPIKSENK